MSHFDGFDLAAFWEDSDYARREYVLPYPTDFVIATVERKLGYKLPGAYIELMRHQNGGLPKKTAFPTDTPTSWAEDHVAIHGILGIGDARSYSLCGEAGSDVVIAQLGYPPIGVYFGDCPSAGHDMICLDYRNCGPSGEPRVVHVDQELDYRLTPLADDFESFVRGLVDDDCFLDADGEDSVAFVWRTEIMTARIRRDDEFLAIGQYLHLEQDLGPNDSGWLSMKISIPEHWDVRGIEVGDGLVRLDTTDSGSFALTRDNVGRLSSELLRGGEDASDLQLQAIWTKHAAIGA